MCLRHQMSGVLCTRPSRTQAFEPEVSERSDLRTLKSNPSHDLIPFMLFQLSCCNMAGPCFSQNLFWGIVFKHKYGTRSIRKFIVLGVAGEIIRANLCMTSIQALRGSQINLSLPSPLGPVLLVLALVNSNRTSRVTTYPEYPSKISIENQHQELVPKPYQH